MLTAAKPKEGIGPVHWSGWSEGDLSWKKLVTGYESTARMPHIHEEEQMSLGKEIAMAKV